MRLTNVNPGYKGWKGALTYFRKLALHSDKEIHAYLVGLNISPTLTRIEHFVYSDYEEQTATSVRPCAKTEKAIARWTLEKDLQIVGTIHSHPNWYPVLSPGDHEGHIESGHRVSAVVGILKGRTQVYFWLSESSLPCKVEYF